jgi:hypothetical protein
MTQARMTGSDDTRNRFNDWQEKGRAAGNMGRNPIAGISHAILLKPIKMAGDISFISRLLHWYRFLSR